MEYFITYGRVSIPECKYGYSDSGQAQQKKSCFKSHICPDTGRASIDHFDHPYYYYDSGVSLVHLATYRSNIDLLKYLISRGANANAKDAEGNTALHTAAEHTNSVEVIEYLISQGLDVNERNDNAPKVFFQRGFTPLHKAAWRNSNIEILKCLIAHGADANANAKDYNDKTPLDVADSEEKKRLLRKSMLEPEEAIWKAATDGDWEAVKRWIEYDPSLSKTSDEAWVENEEFADITLLHLAVAEQDVDLLKYLISHGADVNAEDYHQRGLNHFVSVFNVTEK